MPISQEPGTTYNPMDVMMGRVSGRPYLNTMDTPAGTSGGSSPTPNSPSPTGTLAPSAVRATGKGPFDPAYRQNIATYAGGQFFPPGGGNLSFNPTDISTFPGSPVTGGNAPLRGTPYSLLALAQGGLPFSLSSPLGSLPNPLSTLFGGGDSGGGSGTLFGVGGGKTPVY